MAPRYALGMWLYVRLLGAVAAVAFVSFWVQLEGLVGASGIVPAAELLDTYVAHEVGFFDRPTLAWLGTSNGALHALCAAGVVASLLVTTGVLPKLGLFLVWALYLSVVNVGGPFMAFQWDTLLLETTFLTALAVPFRLLDRPKEAREPDPVRRWLVWFLLFRLMFRSGVVKLMSGDPTWANLTALEYHYETQPLPSPLAWYAHHLPDGLHAASTALMFAIELAVPFLLFVPRAWARRAAAACFAGLMFLISITGSYGFFNLLTLVLCVALLDDALLLRLVPARWREALEAHREERPSIPPSPTTLWAARLAPAAALALSALVFATGFSRPPAWLAPIRPFHTFNNYGLFAVMTTERPEIVIEGSADGRTWKPYRFPHKPGDPGRAPTYNQPHQPRLDWQMWFAALGDYRRNPWLLRFMQRLREGEPEVLGLLEENPFPDAPPTYVRAVLYDYRFTTPEERGGTGDWWVRERLGLYAPVLRPRTPNRPVPH